MAPIELADGRHIVPGIADGVGGWSELDVDAGIYSRQLMSNAKKIAERTGPSSDAPQDILIQAHSQTDVQVCGLPAASPHTTLNPMRPHLVVGDLILCAPPQGSSTACIVMLDGATLRAANLGDSGFLVLRNDQIVFRSPSQQHQFNFPYQLAGPGCTGDSPLAAEVRSDCRAADCAERPGAGAEAEAVQTFNVGVKKGDVVVLATDGVIDNVYPQEAAGVVSVIQMRGDPPRVAASGLAEFAKFRCSHCPSAKTML